MRLVCFDCTDETPDGRICWECNATPMADRSPNVHESALPNIEPGPWASGFVFETDKRSDLFAMPETMLNPRGYQDNLLDVIFYTVGNLALSKIHRRSRWPKHRRFKSRIGSRLRRKRPWISIDVVCKHCAQEGFSSSDVHQALATWNSLDFILSTARAKHNANRVHGGQFWALPDRLDNVLILTAALKTEIQNKNIISLLQELTTAIPEFKDNTLTDLAWVPLETKVLAALPDSVG
jgi:hypothetical protein